MERISIRVKRLIAFALALLILWQVIPTEVVDTYAEEMPMMYFDLFKNGEVMEDATITATFKQEEESTDISLSYKEGEGRYVGNLGEMDSDSISKNEIVVTIEADGYETVYKTIENTYDAVSMVLEGAYSGMENHELFQVNGTVRGFFGWPVKKVSVSAHRNGEEEAVATTETNESGAYELKLTNGSYILTYSKEGYATRTTELVVNGGTVTKDIPLKQKYVLKIHKKIGDENTSEDVGTILVTVSGNEITPIDNQYFVEEGDKVKVTVEPNDSYRLTEEMERKLTSESEAFPDDGAKYSISFNTLQGWPADNQYDIFFEANTKAVLKYDGERIFYYRPGPNGSITVNQRTFTATPDEKYYVSEVESENDTLQEADGVYTFTEGREDIAGVSFALDKEAPTLRLSVSDNTLLMGYKKENGEYVPGGNENFWYINTYKYLFADAEDAETGVDQVSSKIAAQEEEEMELTTPPHTYSIEVDPFDVDGTTGKPLTITATDNAGNSTSQQVQVFYDNESPSVNSVDLNPDMERVYVQNGVTYIGGEEALLDAIVEDAFGIKNIYYIISETPKSDADIKQDYETNQFQCVESNQVTENPQTSDKITFTFPAEIKEEQKGGLYVYVLAEDFAGNIDLSKVRSFHFRRDADAPTINNLTDVSAHKDIYKRSSDSISMNGVFEDSETPSGMAYYVTKPKKITTAEDKEQPEKPSATDPSISWNSFGDQSSSQSKYDRVLIPVEGVKEEGSYIVWVYVKDGCENVSEGTSYLFHIDDKEPTIETLAFDVRENGEEAKGWFFSFGNFFRKNTVDQKKQTVTVKLKAKDLINEGVTYDGAFIGIKDLKLYYVTDAERAKMEEVTTNIKDHRSLPAFTHVEAPVSGPVNGEYTFEFHIPEGEKFYRLVAIATDKAGNTVYYIPTMTEGAYRSDEIMWDRNAPTLSMELTKDYEKPDYVSGKKNWYRGDKDVTYKLTASEVKTVNGKEVKEAGLFETILTINEKETKKDAYSVISPDAAVIRMDYHMSASEGMIDQEDGHVTYEVSVQDNAGNITRAKETIYIDEDKPDITKISFTDKLSDDLKVVEMQYGYFFRKKTTVTITANDHIKDTHNDGSGIKHFTYYMVDSEGEKSEEKKLSAKKKGDEYTASFSIPQGFKGQIYVKATDQTGQESDYEYPKGTVIEDQTEHEEHAKAEIKLPATSYKDEEGNPLYNYLPTLQYITKDTKSGIRQNVWSVKPYHLGGNEAEGELTISSVYQAEKDRFESELTGDTDWSVSKKLDLNLITTANRNYAVKNQMNHIEAQLQLTDNVGNKTKKEIKVFSVDTTNPEIEVEYDNEDVQNDKYYKEPRTAKVTVTERNFTKEGAELIITGDGVKVGEWQHNAGGGCNGTVHTDECTHICDITFDEDGEYTFTVNCTDLAGNQGSYGQTDEFVIDLTSPVVEVTYDNNEAENGTYYKEKRTATIAIEEKNFDDERTIVTITAKKQGQPIEIPAVTAFVTSEEMNTATVNYEQDGDYTFDIEITDLAGNEADIFVPDSFTVDTTAPELIIEGVEDGSANQGTVAPVITYTDINLEEEAMITLTGANLGKVNYEQKITKIENGRQIDLGDFKHVKEVDDLYTLETTIWDLAGNETTDERTFSVNRFGSVYVLSEETKELMDDFYTKEEKDLIITEINVDTLEFKEIVSSIDGDIQTLEEGKDYEVKRGSANQKWKAYEYHIGAENFTKEGAYVVTIYSEDRAKNKSSNKAKGKELNFVVDKTAPSIVVAGIEDGGQYREVSREITVDVQDNVLLKNVDVYVDGGLKQTTGQEELLEANGIVKVTLAGANQRQILSVQSKDAAGNKASSAQISFLITKNLLIQWYSNKPLFIGSLIGIAGIAMAITFLAGKRKKESTAEA